MNVSPVIAAEAASDYKGDVSKIGASLCFFVPLSLVCSSVLVSIFSSITGLEGTELLPHMQSGAPYIVYTLICSLLPLLFCIGFMLKLQKRRFTLLSLKPSVDKKGFLHYVALGVLSIPVSIIVANLTQNVLQSFNIKIKTITAPSGTVETVFFFIVFVVLIPILEEILFRFAVLERLRRYGDVAAILISAMLFSFGHSSFQSFPHTFVMGIVLGFVAVKTKSALAPIIIHSVNNLLSTVSIVITASAHNTEVVTQFGIIICAVFTLSLIAFIVCRNSSADSGFEFMGKEIKATRKASLVFSNFWVIIFLVISVSYAFFTISI